MRMFRRAWFANMRMTKAQWLGQFFRPVFGKRPKRTKPTKETQTFARWLLVGTKLRTEANTKSEARAHFKKMLGVDRLAVGQPVVRI